MDIKYLSQRAEEMRRKPLFVGIDRATRWGYLEVRPDKSAQRAKGFLERLIDQAPFRVSTRC